ncbi:tumor necrosis factor ligand superfamily member 6-like [Chiloscyllium plagiosum]|uniref:tumor necrosis factor ligand superfamily member 6-like n=1 Tax=Chiloscyllium plagiosum TaxID=36176 RepID=UPI001CB7F986|nr:tumor necrosis factor ligand superfamily member 6-like [Chiloscyllium plagiosum]
MERRNLYSMKIPDRENRPPCQPSAAWPATLPEYRLDKKLGWLKVCHIVTVIMFLLILAGLLFGICYLHQLQQEVEQVKQMIDVNPQTKAQKQIGAENITKPKQVVKMAAHLTGKASSNHSKRLIWESSLGHAFTDGILYKDGALIINETGKYFIYTKIYFRGMQCETVTLTQSVIQRNVNYQNDMSLMENTMLNYCSGTGPWAKNTFQAGIFHLSQGVQLFVSVSHPRMVSTNELMTFFGLYKL